MRVFDFTHAIVRTPGHSVVDGLRDDASVTPTFERVLAQHTAYVAALRGAGLAVDVLPALEAFPDSVFVEDPALTFPQGAILMRPGAPSRAGEREDMRRVLRRHFDRVLELQDHEHADGGDILVTPHTVFIGLSARTTQTGAEALARNLATLGRKSRIIEAPKGVLHLKTAASLVSEDTMLVMKQMIPGGVFADFRLLSPPAGEEAAANSLRINDEIFVGESYPGTIALLRQHGFAVRPLPVDEVAKLDAGFSCMSLRW
ncbi:MAG: dimethylarginine dimethylaminohydrolase family protein [Rhizomicrobium sp.]